MARRKSGVFGKVLEIIGLVDDEDPRDAEGTEYGSGSYGRPSTYIPQQQRSRSEETRRRTVVRDERPVRDERVPRYDTPRYQDGYSAARRRSALVERVDDSRGGVSRRSYDDAGDGIRGSSAQRRAPRFQEEPSRQGRYAAPREERFDENLPAVRENRPASRQRTVMYSLHTLEECCDVIDHLIASNTVVLTLDALDPKMLQRAVDTLSGAVFALHATIRKASDHTYLIAPATVEVNETYDVDRRF